MSNGQTPSHRSSRGYVIGISLSALGAAIAILLSYLATQDQSSFMGIFPFIVLFFLVDFTAKNKQDKILVQGVLAGIGYVLVGAYAFVTKDASALSWMYIVDIAVYTLL